MGFGIVSWLLGSRLGRRVALVGITVIGVLTAIGVVFRKGQKAERARQQRQLQRRLRDAVEIRTDLRSKSRDEIRKELEEWARD